MGLEIALSKEEYKLYKSTIPYLEAFINEMNGFYPFAMIMDSNGIISTIAPDIEEKSPVPQYLIDLYEKGISKEFLKEKAIYVLAVICVNVIIHTENKEDDNAVEFRFTTPKYKKTIRVVYEINSNNINFQTKGCIL